jgi:predicted metal-dependent hydrolase
MMKLITYGSETFEYRVEKKKRKTLGIKITNDGEVIVTAPLGVGESIIYDIVKKKASWIVEKLRHINEMKNELNNEEFIDGRKVEFLGQAYMLSIFRNSSIKNNSVSLNGDNITVCIKSSHNGDISEAIKCSLINWLKEQAKIKLVERTKYYGEKTGLMPNNIRVKEQKTLWGSCSGKNNINYNWKLIMAPPRVLDYVVVHELCHLRQRDHSKKFWELVEEVMPDYKELRKWLKENGRRLNI